MGKEYENATTVAEFASAQSSLFQEVVRITKLGGSICWQVGYHVRNNVVTPLDYLVYECLNNFKELRFRNRIIWVFGHGLHASRRFSGRHEVVMWFTKGEAYEFDLDAVRVPQRYPGKLHYKGPARGTPSGNPLGKNPSDVWEIPNVKGNHVEKTSHPCQFPVALARRLITSLSKVGDLICDPYLGSGSTAVAALSLQRNFVGAEISRRYFKIATERAKAALKGDAVFRPEDKPIYSPPPNSPLTTRPLAWK